MAAENNIQHYTECSFIQEITVIYQSEAEQLTRVSGTQQVILQISFLFSIQKGDVNNGMLFRRHQPTRFQAVLVMHNAL